MDNRMSKDLYYLNIAETVLERSTCLRRKYGAIIVKNDEIISTGYNGAPRGEENCSSCGFCFREKLGIPKGERYELCKSVHAEQNAIISAARRDMIGATIYIVGREVSNGAYANPAPCLFCRRFIVNAGITRCVGMVDGKPVEQNLEPPKITYTPRKHYFHHCMKAIEQKLWLLTQEEVEMPMCEADQQFEIFLRLLKGSDNEPLAIMDMEEKFPAMMKNEWFWEFLEKNRITFERFPSEGNRHSFVFSVRKEGSGLTEEEMLEKVSTEYPLFCQDYKELQSEQLLSEREKQYQHILHRLLPVITGAVKSETVSEMEKIYPQLLRDPVFWDRLREMKISCTGGSSINNENEHRNYTYTFYI